MCLAKVFGGNMNLKWLILLAVLLVASARAEDDRYVIASSVNVREHPTLDAKVVTKLPIATRVAIKQTDKEWVLVDVQSDVHKGQRGWIAVEFLVSERPTVESLLSEIERAPENDFKAREKWAERAMALKEFVGEFSNMGKADVTGDCSGYKVWIWNVGQKIIGRFSMFAGDCGDSLDDRNPLSNVVYDPNTNKLSFKANSIYGDFLVLNFSGKLNRDTLNGTITYWRLDTDELTRKESVVLKKLEKH
jgi:uncharacterized protein YgiM (DUF1202 family)